MLKLVPLSDNPSFPFHLQYAVSSVMILAILESILVRSELLQSLNRPPCSSLKRLRHLIIVFTYVQELNNIQGG
jgi:hypothetical protein